MRGSLIALIFKVFFLATLSFFSYKFYNQSLMLQGKKMVFWEWKVSLNLQINLWRIDIFTTLNFSTQEHGIYTSLLKCTYLHFRNFSLFLPIGFTHSLLNLCLNFLSFGIINVVCSAVMLTYYLCLWRLLVSVNFISLFH